MFALILLLCAINIPLAFFLARRFELKSFFVILFMTLAQYTASAMVAGQIMTGLLNRPSLESITQGFGLAIMGILILSPVGVPVLLITSAMIYFARR